MGLTMKTCEINKKDQPCKDQTKNLKRILNKIPSDWDLQIQSDQFKAISDPTRLKILYILQEGELCACEIITALEKPQSTISHHLNVLKNVGFVNGRKEGIWIYYKLINPKIIDLIGNLTKNERN